jgi:hypothetical protein
MADFAEREAHGTIEILAEPMRCAQPSAVESLRAHLNLNALNKSYARMYL